MPEIPLLVLLVSVLAGLTIPLGGLLARFDLYHPSWLRAEVRHGVVAFGGGALIAAVALVLVPEGVRRLPALVALACFAGGGMTFFLIDQALNRLKGHFGQLLAMLVDFIPEAASLGALMALGEPGLALVLMIALQNLPEGFNAFHDMTRESRQGSGRILASFGLLVLLGPIAAVSGHIWLSSLPGVLGGVMMVAAGGVIYLTVEDVIPDAHLENRRAPALGAVAGFALGLTGYLYLA